MLTFPRELYVEDHRLRFRPAAELVGLRRAEVDWQAGRRLVESASEVLAHGPVRLLLTHGRRADLVVDVSGTAADPARIFVDASMVETFAAGAVRTDRAYPDPDSGWVVEAVQAETSVYLLGR